MIEAFALAIILALVHFFSEEHGRHAEKFYIQLISFSAGLFLGIIFLYLLPEFFRGGLFLGENIYILLLAGFVFFHLGEKYVYQHIRNRKELMQDIASLHAVGFFTEHFIIGITLFLAFKIEGSVSGFLLFLPLLLHSFSSSISLNHIDSHFKRKSISGILLPLSPFFGVCVAYFLQFSYVFYYALFSPVLGAMLYIAIRDMLPKKEEGNQLFFIAGVLFSILSITLVSFL